VHRALQPLLHNDAIVIDATAGNGHDTLFLARHLSDRGHLYAFDIQLQAIEQTRNRLARHGLLHRATLIQANHAEMAEAIPVAHHGKIDLIIFNLGYLPHGDKGLITQADSTIRALQSATHLLSPSGRISLLVYPAHPGGATELQAINRWLAALPARAFAIRRTTPANPDSPQWIEIVRTD